MAQPFPSVSIMTGGDWRRLGELAVAPGGNVPMATSAKLARGAYAAGYLDGVTGAAVPASQGPLYECLTRLQLTPLELTALLEKRASKAADSDKLAVLFAEALEDACRR
ncbi:MAG: hypothetical protein ACRELS_20225 [Candidatus Rokuibacteriota bacterium]